MNKFMPQESNGPFEFGDYCLIEQKRFGVANEMYLHKVIGSSRSNCWVDTPVQTPAIEVMHDKMEDVVSCICCGVRETEVRKYRLSDCHSTAGSAFGKKS